ncbi:MAG: molecular chaperone [Candidatus Binatia bacterium]
MTHSSERFEAALARGAVYRFLSNLFVYPDPDVWAALHGEVTDHAANSWASLGWSVSGFEPLRSTLLESSRELFEAEYVSIFGHTAAGRVPPYEARYGPRHLFQETECLADIAGFYGAFGLETAQACRERPDHIAVELEFVHVLGVKEAYALENHWSERAALCVEARRDFMQQHLARWAPSFLRRLAEAASRGLFEKVAEVTAACLAADLLSLGVSAPSDDLELSEVTLDPAGSNFSCAAEGDADGVTSHGFPLKEEVG